MADNLALIRSKNAAYHALAQAVIYCERERHRSGEIPATWRARLAELRAGYDRALAAWEVVKGNGRC